VSRTVGHPCLALAVGEADRDKRGPQVCTRTGRRTAERSNSSARVTLAVFRSARNCLAN
jgi:hypothetical protein